MWKRFALWALKLLVKAAAEEAAKRVRAKHVEAKKLEYQAGQLVAKAAEVKAEAESLAKQGYDALFKVDA